MHAHRRTPNYRLTDQFAPQLRIDVLSHVERVKMTFVTRNAMGVGLKLTATLCYNARSAFPPEVCLPNSHRLRENLLTLFITLTLVLTLKLIVG